VALAGALLAYPLAAAMAFTGVATIGVEMV
jgi:hypothetical protein